jgi:hypothetical protein
LWYDHDGLTACTERCLILGDRFVFSLFFVMLQYSPHPRFIPTCGKPIPLCHLFLSYSPTVCLQRLADELVRCNYEHTVWFRIPYIYYPQISSRVGLPDRYSRIFIAGAVFAAVCQSLLDLIFAYVVIVNVGYTGPRINKEAEVHAGRIGVSSSVSKMETGATLSAQRLNVQPQAARAIVTNPDYRRARLGGCNVLILIEASP